MKVPDTDYVAPTTVNAMDVAEAAGVEAYKQKTLREQQALENTRKNMKSFGRTVI